MERNKYEFEDESNSIHFLPPRTPLNAIPDPSQYQRQLQDLDLESKEKFKSSRGHRPSDKKIEDSNYQLTLNKAIGNLSGSIYGTPRVSGRGKAHSEPNSVQRTPARSVSRVSNIGASSGACVISTLELAQGPLLKFFRAISLLNSEQSIEVSYFELFEDPSFRNDHNVHDRISHRNWQLF
ncbi:phragmoplast orienting kinesin 1 [Actinidia rufa]|uniref:Phragmoplast orienting kinesin 1 n=1 Tax=Actinidia rufa TaxID=165716 RepID=A0A7J0DMJ8_9ERIC|nr:phragmoplast orienting kinesin 1 [Actinidia rufa]